MAVKTKVNSITHFIKRVVINIFKKECLVNMIVYKRKFGAIEEDDHHSFPIKMMQASIITGCLTTRKAILTFSRNYDYNPFLPLLSKQLCLTAYKCTHLPQTASIPYIESSNIFNVCYFSFFLAIARHTL